MYGGVYATTVAVSSFQNAAVSEYSEPTQNQTSFSIGKKHKYLIGERGQNPSLRFFLFRFCPFSLSIWQLGPSTSCSLLALVMGWHFGRFRSSLPKMPLRHELISLAR